MALRSRVLAAIQSLYSSPSPATGYMFASGTGKMIGDGFGNGAEDWQSMGESLNPLSAYSGSNLLRQLYRVQSADWSFNIPRQNVSQFGQFAPIEQIILNAPTVSLNFSYLLANLYNEASGLGFTVTSTGNVTNAPTSAISGILTKITDEKNYFLKVSREGIDSVNDAETNLPDIQTFGIGNGFLSSYSVNLAVGQLPTVTVGIDALNIAVANGVTGQSPAVNPSNGVRSSRRFRIPTATESAGAGINDYDISALRPGDVVLSIAKRTAAATEPYATLGYDVFGADISGAATTNIITNARVQNCNISFNLSRTSIEKLGSKFAVSKELVFPVDINASMDVIATDFISGDLSSLIDCDRQYDIHIDLKRPATCGATAQPIVAKYILKGAKVESENSRLTIDGNQTIALAFKTSIGGPNQTAVGLFMSGACVETL